MRTNIIIDDSQKKKWWEIKEEAAKRHMKIGDYLIYCHNIRKKMEEKNNLMELLNKPLAGGKKGIDAIEATKSMWKL
ncbi:hypothetical protein ES706_03996 [subsurface metagenome]